MSERAMREVHDSVSLYVCAGKREGWGFAGEKVGVIYATATPWAVAVPVRWFVLFKIIFFSPLRRLH